MGTYHPNGFTGQCEYTESQAWRVDSVDHGLNGGAQTERTLGFHKSSLSQDAHEHAENTIRLLDPHEIHIGDRVRILPRNRRRLAGSSRPALWTQLSAKRVARVRASTVSSSTSMWMHPLMGFLLTSALTMMVCRSLSTSGAPPKRLSARTVACATRALALASALRGTRMTIAPARTLLRVVDPPKTLLHNLKIFYKHITIVYAVSSLHGMLFIFRNTTKFVCFLRETCLKTYNPINK